MSWASKLGKTLCNAWFCWTATKTILLLLVYYSLSISLTFYQRWFLQIFHFPLYVCLCHMMIKFILAWLCRAINECTADKERLELGWKNYVMKVFPAGITSGLDIGLSQWGLELITVSLYTMTKSTSIIFILGFALVFKLEKKSWSLLVIVLMISSGLFMFTYEATQFDTAGFLMVLTASLASGFRWTLAQFVMQKSKLGLTNPIDMVYHMQPWMVVSLIPFAVYFEGINLASTYQGFRFEHWSSVAPILGGIFAGAFIAFLMEATEFLVLSKTSSLTLSIASIVKEIFTLVLAVNVAGDKMSFINLIGLFICLGGIVFHVIHKVTSTNPPNTDEFDDTGEDIHMPLLDVGKGVLLMEDALNIIGNSSDEDDEDVIFSVLNRPGR